MSDRKLAALDTTNDRPFTLVFHSLDHDVGEILYGGESDLCVFKALRHNCSPVLEVELGLKGVHVGSGFMRMGKVVEEQAWLEERILEDLNHTSADQSAAKKMR